MPDPKKHGMAVNVRFEFAPYTLRAIGVELCLDRTPTRVETKEWVVGVVDRALHEAEKTIDKEQTQDW